MGGRKLSFSALAVALGAAIAVWVSSGTLTLASGDAGAPRVGLLPSPAWLGVLLIVVLVLVLWLRPSRRHAAVLAVSGFALLPWLPLRVPPVALIWTGHLSLWLWIGITAVLVAPAAGRAAPAALATLARDPRRAPWIAAAMAACAYLVGAWQVFPRLPGGDEPHYLIITQSLLEDRDLQIENNHRQGGYRAYYDGELKPDYLRRGRDGQIYSIHAPGLPAMIAPIFALFGYPGVVTLLALASGGATALAWIAAWRVSRNVAASWFGWAAVALSAPFFFQSFMVFPDGPGAMLVMAGVLALLAGRELDPRMLLVTGAGLALLPWLHTRFAILASALGVLVLLRQLGSPRPLQRTLVLLSVPVVSAAAWFWLFYAVYGTPNPAAPYGGYTQSAAGNLPRGVTGLLFDQQFGIVPNAPVYVCAAVGLVAMLKTAPRLLLELFVVIVPYSLATAAYQMWWGGYSSPARFLVPVVLPLAIPAAVWFAGAGRGSRVLGLGALFASLLVTATLSTIEHASLLFNARDGAARWLLWLSPVVNLTTALPSSFQNPPLLVLGHAAVWAIAIIVTGWIGTAAARRGATTQTIAACVACVAAVSGMTAMSVVWRSNDATPLTPTPGGTEVLHNYEPDRGQIGLRYSPLRRVKLAELPSMITLAATTPATHPRNQPLIVLPRPAAAAYEIEAVVTGPNASRLTAAIDRQFRPGWTWDISGVAGAWHQTVTLPIPVRELVVDADPATRRAIDRISIRAISSPGTRQWRTDAEPVHTTRYGPSLVSLLDGRAYMEPAGTWVAGDRRAQFAIAPDGGAPIRLFVRNAPIDNTVTLESGGWRQTLTMKSREERLIDVPIEAGRVGALLSVMTAAGARPSEFEPGNNDRRLLGCWIETR